MEGKYDRELKRNTIHVKKYEENDITGQTDVTRDEASTEAMPSERIVRPTRETKPQNILRTT